MYSKLAPFLALVATASAQNVCTLKPETHPSVSYQECKGEGQCEDKKGEVVVDANWRWLHTKQGYTNCYTGNLWNTTSCPDGAACTENCCLDGAEYAPTYGVSTEGNKVKMAFVTKTKTGELNVGARLYLMESETKYKVFKLLNNEFSFDVDVSKVPCGINAALYFVSMDADGGMAKYPTNKAGAKYGTGYCDAQCPRDLKFIDGKANVEGWEPSKNDKNAGVGNRGSCCSEMDIWESNSISAAYTPHPCKTIGQKGCEKDLCGGTYSGKDSRYLGECDPDGCDFNSFRMGVKDFYGKGKTVDTSTVITVVTQFIAKGDDLAEIKRFYVQNGKVIPNSKSTIPGVEGDSITEGFCDAQKKVFGDKPDFQEKGGMKQMGKALAEGMVLALSLWDDHYANTLWLDSTYPVDSTKLGAARGECPTTSGDPAQVEKDSPDSTVTYSNIKFGPIGSTYKTAK